MGELFRRYWLPALLASELPSADPPVRVQLLSERLIAFRDSSNRLGLMDEFARIAACRSGSAATRKAACVAPTTAGSTT